MIAGVDVGPDPRTTPLLARREGRLATWAAIVLVLALHGVGRVGAYCSPIHADSYVYAVVGYRLAHGDVMYRDVSDVKPPGLYYLYALGYLFFPPTRAAMIPFDTVFGILGYWAVYALARDLYGHALGLIVTIVAALAFNFFMAMDFATDGFGLAEGYMILPAALAVRHYRRAAHSHGLGPLWVCGFCIGLEATIKQTVLPLGAAVAIHWTLRRLGAARRPRQWLGGGLMISSGFVVALAPFLLLTLCQGTTSDAISILASGGRMLGLQTAWPSQWNNIVPLWTPLIWGAFVMVWSCDAVRRSRAAKTDDLSGSLASGGDGLFLVLWLLAECVMAVYLPLRAFHYYVLSCLPLLILSGAYWRWIHERLSRISPQAHFAGLCCAGLLSVSLSRPALDTLVPTAIARWRSYEASKDRANFLELLSRGPDHFGAAPIPAD